MTGAAALPDQPDDVVACPEAEARALLAEARTMAPGVPPVLGLSFIRGRGWACLPLEDELQGDAVSRLGEACRLWGFAAAWAVEVPWAEGGRVPVACRLAISARTLQAVSKDRFIGSGFILVEAGGGFACASDGDLYWMLAGRADFVERAAGMTGEMARARFTQTASAYGDSLAGRRLRLVQEVAMQTAQA